MSRCTIQGCATDEKYLARGMCNRHYKRWQKHGDPLREAAPVHERFWAKVDLTGDCWLWTAALDRQGYGAFNDGRRIRKAQQMAWELLVGSIPDGLVLDHLCRVRHCVNPGHLEPVTIAENGRRAALKLTAALAAEMRDWRRQGKTLAWIAETYGVDPAHASRVCRGLMWAEDHTGEALAIGWLHRIESVA